MKALVLAEKPSVARDIARVLKCGKKLNGAIEGGNYIVTWGLGHLVTLADPENYDEKYKEWKIEYLPMMPEQLKLEVIRQTGKQFQAVKTQINRQDVGEIIIATDAGREGELVARLILMKTGCKKPIKRLWISSVTDKAIREGFAHLRNGHDYDNLFDAAMSRAEADWLVGINATRALTCRYNAQLSCGRVQTPTLAMIAAREDEIKRFVPKPYYGISARGNGILLTWQDAASKSYSTFDREKVRAVYDKVRNEEGTVTEVSRLPKKTYAPLLYDLTELQRDANKRYNFSAKETLNIMQRLYENHKVLTYPRTDSRYLSTDVADTLRDRLKAVSTGPYRKSAGRLVNRPLPKNMPFVDNSKVSDHHAIIPTEQFVQLEHMSGDERKIYDLVIRRFLAVLYPPFEYEQTTIVVKAGGESFIAKGRIIKAPGWKEVYENQEDGEEAEEEGICGQELPDIKKGDCLNGLVYSVTEGKTKPPAPFNEATLLSAMENPVKYMETRDKDMIKALGETGGLGTVATRADIIEKLFNSFLIEKKGKDIFVTSKARQLLELVPEELKKPELTADWEMKLAGMAKGTLKRNAFMRDIRAYAAALTQEIKTGEGQFRHDNLTNSKCPECGKRMLLVNGKNSRLLVCQDRECGYRETIARTSNARCPVCHKKMELTGKGEKQVFICSCGRKEKLSAFQDRRKKEGAGVSKKDVARYLNQQQKEAKAPVNNGLAEALAKLNQQNPLPPSGSPRQSR